MRSVNVSETRENLAQLLDAVEAGEEVVIMRRDRPVARLVPMDKPMAPFLDRSRLRNELPPMKTTAAQAVRALRDEERY
jgi:prevent-host-death family protein